MAKRKKQRISHAETVRLFAEKLREIRVSRGMSQAELSHHANVTEAYVGRLERGEGEPGIALVARLAKALGVEAADLLPATTSPDTLAVLRDQTKRLVTELMQSDDRETFLTLNPLLRLLVAEKRK